MEENPDALVIDVREPYGFDQIRIEGSIHAPRGILENCCEWDYVETIPELVKARQRPVLVVCRSGQRSVMAAYTMQLLGYEKATSLKLGLKGWNDDDMPLINDTGERVDADFAEEFFNPYVSEEKLSPT